VSRDPVCRQLLSDIASKCRSEAVALITAGQRATAQCVGGADLRANVDIAVLGRFSRASEGRKTTGEEIDLPDMGKYGEGKPGVWLVYELGGGGGYDRGRVFRLEDPAEIDTIVARRAATRRPYVPEPALATLAGLWAKVTCDAPIGVDEDDYDAVDLDVSAPPDLVQGTEDITAKTASALAGLARHGHHARRPPAAPAGHGSTRRRDARAAAAPGPREQLRRRGRPGLGPGRPAAAAGRPGRDQRQ
jgi:hypothetical protein